jgi:hypothetical protein
MHNSKLSRRIHHFSNTQINASPLTFDVETCDIFHSFFYTEFCKTAFKADSLKTELYKFK